MPDDIMLPKDAEETNPMTPSADVSNLSGSSRTTAAQGLSIVVPAFNEAAGLARLHERLCALAAALKTAGATRVTVLPICRLLKPSWAANVTYQRSQHQRPWRHNVCPVTGGPCP